MAQTALTLSEAAAACGVSRSTVKRKLAQFQNARQDDDGVWRVPIADLLGAGLKLRPRPAETATQGHDPGLNGADQGQIRELTEQLAAERMARQVAETEVRLLTANLEDVRFSLRALSGPPRAPESPRTAPAVSVEALTPVRGSETLSEPVPVSPRHDLAAETVSPRRRWPWSRVR